MIYTSNNATLSFLFSAVHLFVSSGVCDGYDCAVGVGVDALVVVQEADVLS